MTSPRPSLFRPEAIEFQRQRRQWGEVVLLQPLSGKITFWAIAAAIILIACFLFLAQYARKETVAAYLTPTAGVVKVFAPRPGTIKAIHVADGQEVKENQLLLTVAIDQTTPEGENVDAAVLDSLARQKSLLDEQIAVQERRELPERARLEKLISGIANEIVYIERQITVQQSRVQLSDTSSIEELHKKGIISKAEYNQRRDLHLEQKQHLAALGQQLAAAETQLSEARSSLEQLPASVAEKIHTLRSALSEIDQRIAEINGRRAYVVRAPLAGRVSALQAVVGRTVDPSQLQLSILPTGNLLQAELFVPTRAVGFVRPGQQVRILYDAFPYQRFGFYGGRIVAVTRTILMPSDGIGPVPLQEPAYKATVALDRQDITAYGERVPLQADMLLRADIILERRPLIAWLLNPLLSARL
jgi:membrane fusion protein